MRKRLTLASKMKRKATNAAKQTVYIGLFQQDPPKNKRKVKAYA